MNKASAKALTELVEHHIKEEERNIWHDVRERLTRSARMNVALEAAKRQVKLS